MSITGTDWLLKSAFQTELSNLMSQYPDPEEKKDIKEHLEERLKQFEDEIKKSQLKYKNI
mgnify:CR=1 FL=1